MPAAPGAGAAGSPGARSIPRTNRRQRVCSPNPVRVGQHLTCTIDVTAAPNTLGSGRVTDAFPPGVRVTRATYEGVLFVPFGAVPATGECEVSGNTVTCPPEGDEFIITNFPGSPKDTIKVTIHAVAEQCGTFTNTARFEDSIEGFPFFTTATTVRDTEQIAVEGCAGPPPPTQEIEQEAESGDVEQSFGVSNEGDYSDQCAPAEQFGQTANAQDAPGALQYANGSGDFEAGGVGFAAEPGAETACERAVGQSSSSSG